MSFRNAVCRGSLALGSACGHCERCEFERMALKAINEDKSRDPAKPVRIGELSAKIKELQSAKAEQADAFQPDLFENAKSYAEGGLIDTDAVVPAMLSTEHVIPADKLGLLSANIGSVAVGSLKHGNVEYFANGDITIHKGGKVPAEGITVAGIKGLPVAGYEKTVEQWKIDMVNENKLLEEKVLRRVDEHVRNRDSQEIDQASVQLARRHVEDAFYRLNRAIMQPKRILGDLD